ncbi:MAG: Fic family protein [Nannocystaceae bacterium]
MRAQRPHHTSWIDANRRHTLDEDDGRYRVDVYPSAYLRDDTPLGHLVFALKYDGLDLGILRQVLVALPEELTRALRDAPTSKPLRRLWFLYEWFTGQVLALPDAPRLRYEPLADPARYYTVPGERSPRHAIQNNLLGTPAWSPLVRRTERLAAATAEPLAERARAITARCDPKLLQRAIHLLYTKETKTSFALENEEIRGPKEQRFVALLRNLHRYQRLTPEVLVEFQNLIVDRRFGAPGYRSVQNFIGDGASDRVYYIPPRPEDVPPMMAGLEAMVRQLSARPGGEPPIPAVIAAALVSFSFVYIHPFEDGNGRLSRLLIHFILARLGFAPSELVLPISAAILDDRAGYDHVLREVDQELLPLLDWEYETEPPRCLIVTGNDAHLYASLDLTPHAEALYRWTSRTIEADLLREIDYLKGFDRATRRMNDIVDLPDRLRALFIKLVAENHFHLSQTKRSRFFDMLEDHEIAALERAVRAGFQSDDDVVP